MRLANLCAVAMGIILTGGLAVAQEPEVPLTWKGEGEANLITAEGEDQIQFDLEFHVDEEGMVTGKTSNDEGGTVLERLYYGDEVDLQTPALDSRKLVLVLRLESSDMPLLIILNGTVLADKHFYGELRVTSSEEDGMEEALNIGDKMATAISGTSLPAGLKKALDKSAPMGFFKVKGKMVTEN